jgi:hypothetical protein
VGRTDFSGKKATTALTKAIERKLRNATDDYAQLRAELRQLDKGKIAGECWPSLKLVSRTLQACY